MPEAPREIAAATNAAAEAAERASIRAERITRRNAELLTAAVGSLEESATLADALAQRVERSGLDSAAATAREHAARARRAARTRLALDD